MKAAHQKMVGLVSGGVKSANATVEMIDTVSMPEQLGTGAPYTPSTFVHELTTESRTS